MKVFLRGILIALCPLSLWAEIDSPEGASFLELGKEALGRSYAAIPSVTETEKTAKDTLQAACAREAGCATKSLGQAESKCLAQPAGDLSVLKEAARDSARVARRTKRAMLDDADEAYHLFAKAAHLAPGDPKPLAYEALALLQSERYCETLAKIDEARRLGYADVTKNLLFAHGQALLKNPTATVPEIVQGLDEIRAYADFLKARGGAGSASYVEAVTLLATTGDPEAKAAAAHCALAWGQGKPYVRSFACDIVPKETVLPFSLSVFGGIGYNSNVIALGRHQPYSPAVPVKGSGFAEETLTIGKEFPVLQRPYRVGETLADVEAPEDCAVEKSKWFPDELVLKDTVSLNFIIQNDTYFDRSERNSVLESASLGYRRTFTPHLSGLLQLTDKWLFVDETFDSNQLTAQAGFAVAPVSQFNFQVSYVLTRDDSYTNNTPITDPDGFSHRIEFLQNCVLLEDPVDLSPRLTLSGTYGHEWNQPRGYVGRNEANELNGRLKWEWHVRDGCAFIRGYTVVLNDLWRPNRYYESLVQTPTNPDPYHRADVKNALSLTLTVRMGYDRLLENAGVPDASRLEASLQYRRTTQDSNVGKRAYDQDYFLAALKINF